MVMRCACPKSSQPEAGAATLTVQSTFFSPMLYIVENTMVTWYLLALTID